ncbi:hypothetical protein JXL19_02755 [bacterium]|nr:hypothetical protein [bacterium]
MKIEVVAALNEFGFEGLNLSEKDFCQDVTIVQLGYEPVRIDIMNSLQGCTFERAWKNKAVGRYGKEEVLFIGLEELIENKKNTKRQQDKDDLDILTAARQ